ncbi:MAG: Gentisate 1,2-dioxygenase [Alphaproteobacteria bacterium MarineAlpha11_Bin1]|nr:MAG: Gentisate 1,2-dioxygenase [Alphaproteobacteria bacterium MarineAlpha11_Bin1]|tara:strand:- start:517 stop:1674 length:1158 start_codon:yes stop_codon:yes gene_type:complete
MATSTDDSKKRDTNRESRLKEIYDNLHQLDLAAYWATDNDPENHDEDDQVLKARKALPHMWKYSDIEPLLYEAAELITMDDSERRSIVLVNPGLAPVRATVSTLYTAYRLNDPREIMPPHRHSINAVRIGLTGKQNFTGVEGEPITFGPGDVVLTPADAWHNHGNNGDDFAVNVSILDLPLSEVLNAAAFEHDYKEEENGRMISRREQSTRYTDDHSHKTYGFGGLRPRLMRHDRGSGRHSPMYVYRWNHTRDLLQSFRDHDGSPWDSILVEYTDPVTGGTVYPTMTFFGQLMRPGDSTLPQQQNASQIMFPFHGKGYSIVGGQRFDWQPFDAIALPGGEWYQHFNGADGEDASLFVASDEPTLKKLGFYRRKGKTIDGEIINLD